MFIPPHLFLALSWGKSFAFTFNLPMDEMDTTTEQAFAILDMWAATPTQYLAAMGMVLVLYDGLLTYKHEVSLTISCLKSLSIYLLLAGAPRLARTPEFPKNFVLH